MSHVFVQDGPYLRNWYPGLGETRVLETFPRPVLEFLADASEEDPGFVGEYLVPVLEGDRPLDRICCDLSDAIMDAEYSERGLGGLGFLGKSPFKRIKKAVKRIHTAVAKKIMPKALQKIDAKVMKTISKVDTKIHDTTKKVWKKYGNTIISVAGAVLAPFTGGASLAAASVLVAANTAYTKKRQADEAKKAGRRDAAQFQAQADASDRALMQQLDDFYRQNQAWFLEYGITPDKWAGMNLEQKIELINAGAEGRLPRDPGPGTPRTSAPAPAPVSAPAPAPSGGGFVPPTLPPGGGFSPAPSGGGYSPPGGGGGDPSSVWGGSGIGPSGATSPFQSAGASGQPQQARAGMFGDSGMMLPMLALGAVAILGSQKKGGGSRRKRNPSRGRRRRW